MSTRTRGLYAGRKVVNVWHWNQPLGASDPIQIFESVDVATFLQTECLIRLEHRGANIALVWSHNDWYGFGRSAKGPSPEDFGRLCAEKRIDSHSDLVVAAYLQPIMAHIINPRREAHCVEGDDLPSGYHFEDKDIDGYGEAKLADPVRFWDTRSGLDYYAEAEKLLEQWGARWTSGELFS